MVRYSIQLKAAGVPISFRRILAMTLNRSLSRELVSAIVMAHKGSLGLSPELLEVHYRAGGKARKIVELALALRKLGEFASAEWLVLTDINIGRVTTLGEAYMRA